MDKKTLLKKFGKNVKIQRIKRDLTQEKLAEIMDVSQNYIASIECGKANMSLAKNSRTGKLFERQNRKTSYI